MVSYARIQAHTVNDGACIQTLHLGICVKLIEETYSQCQVGIGKQLYSLGLSGTHVKGINVLLDGTLLQQACKGMGSLLQTCNFFIESNDDS